MSPVPMPVGPSSALHPLTYKDQCLSHLAPSLASLPHPCHFHVFFLSSTTKKAQCRPHRRASSPTTRVTPCSQSARSKPLVQFEDSSTEARHTNAFPNSARFHRRHLDALSLEIELIHRSAPHRLEYPLASLYPPPLLTRALGIHNAIVYGSCCAALCRRCQHALATPLHKSQLR